MTNISFNYQTGDVLRVRLADGTSIVGLLICVDGGVYTFEDTSNGLTTGVPIEDIVGVHFISTLVDGRSYD